MTIPLQDRIIYGPLDSRRFGRSLGVNLLPTDRKVCNFDCIYCQYGGPSSGRRPDFPDLDRLEEEFLGYLSSSQGNAGNIQWITIAGNGEPTLHPEFSQAVDRIVSLRDRYLPRVPIGILSNSSTCHRPEIRRALSRLDGRFMKLDAGSQEDVMTGLCRLRNAFLQSIFFTGSADNSREDVVGEWIDAVRLIRPKAVQIYTIDRPPKDQGLLPVPRKKLKEISRRLHQEAGVTGFVF